MQNIMSEQLTIALTKGRILKETLPLIKAGIMVTHGGRSPELSNMGRALTERKMPY